MPNSMSTSILRLLFSSCVVAAEALVWSSCGTNLACTTLTVPLEYAVSTNHGQASIALVRYKAKVSSSQRLGSLLVNPGGPGASGVSFVQNGAGSAISTLTGGLYDIIGWDPRGVGQTRPLLECFPNASAEYKFSEALPGGPNLWLGMFSNSSYDAEVTKRISDFDTSIAGLSHACAAQKSAALYTSSAAYVARDMATIVTALDGKDAKLNYWGFSYGTIYLAEFIQAFPTRVGRVVADGVFDPEANALTYTSQLPNDQISARDAINDLISFCEAAGSNCPLSTPPKGVAATLTKRIDNLFESLFLNPIDYFGTPISLDSFNTFLSSLIIIPATWSLVANIIKGLELRDATLLVNLVSSQTASAPTDPSAPGVGTQSQSPLMCIDNAPSSSITLQTLVKLTKRISIAENTPFLSAGLKPISFCRNFPDTRPLLKNAGVSLMSATDAILQASNTTVLIVNPKHDPSTPLISAKKLRCLLPNSSKIAIRGGSGHTTISLASLSMSQTIHDFFVSGALPIDGEYHNVDQNVFPAGSGKDLVAAPAFNGTYTEAQTKILQATYSVLAAFISLA
ncbi:related to hydrolases or acyltransferases (alpha/beta hydrolase superfamily) [Rhynchosporium agropyri]|uniref:Related to hydrolases or acyltransferases (Alpha/beta hydrolase superfamily) n=1 Tax=Rhynchosporium agropyri TaxID=914238 RepID=A0A1E1K1N5_9HELO|nr:related to hydrolases or acyltransferases (alpha/beta hydrolase superfamily) [Rhynchosporium agropyri]